MSWFLPDATLALGSLYTELAEYVAVMTRIGALGVAVVFPYIRLSAL